MSHRVQYSAGKSFKILKQWSWFPSEHFFLLNRDENTLVLPFGIRSFQEWVEYSKSNQRPSFIPSNPRHTYLEHFQGYGDFLGFDSRGSFTDSPSDIVPISQCRKLYSFAQGLSSFMYYMQKHAPDVEFFPLPREAAASFLIRPGGSGDDSWVPL